MKPLTERVLALIPETPHGLSLRAAVKTLRQDTSYVRAAFERLEKSGKARIARRGRGGALYLLLPSPATLICVIPGCHREFIRGHKSKRVTCSRACHAAYGWRNPEKSAKRRASISAAHKSPKARARLAAFNQKRWSDPKEKEKLALQNSRRWKDRPEEFERYRALMRIIQSTPERKAFYSELRKAFWRDPVMRKKMHDAATKSLRVAAYRSQLARNPSRQDTPVARFSRGFPGMSDPVDFKIIHQAAPGQCDVIRIMAKDGPTILVSFELSPADFLSAIMGQTVIAALSRDGQ